MRRFFAGVAGPLVVVAAWASGALAAYAEYELNVSVRPDVGTVAFEQRLSLPFSAVTNSSPAAREEAGAGAAGPISPEPAEFSRLISSEELTEDADVRPDESDDARPAGPGLDLVVIRHTQPHDGPPTWGTAVRLQRAPLSVDVYVHERHESSPDPFKLVHGSVHSESAWAAAGRWHGPLSASVQYVSAVPLRGDEGPLLFGRLSVPGSLPVRLTGLVYGTARLRHRFVAVDGEWTAGPWRFRWGWARQDGAEVVRSDGSGALRAVAESAVFARAETSFGRHRVWVLLHDTSPGFRSLAASDYPFRRGAAVVEGRWQWRPASGRLLTVYGQRRVPARGVPSVALEAGYSVMPRGLWGWRVDAETSWRDDTVDEYVIALTLTNPDRRWEQSLTYTVGVDGAVRRRVSLGWDGGAWRVRLSADDGLPGWRAEWRWASGETWETVVVFKQRAYPDRGVLSWTHVSLTRDVPDFGSVWLQWMEHDQGRLDVGWTRTPTVGAGVRVFF